MMENNMIGEKMKKILSILLTLSLLMSFCGIGAYAHESNVRVSISEDRLRTQILDAENNSMEFVMAGETNNAYKMYYYYNGVLDRIYLIPKSGGDVLVDVVGENQMYTLNNTHINIEHKATKIINQTQPLAIGDAGYIIYKSSSVAGGRVIANVNQIVSTTSDTYSVITPINTVVADATADLASELIEKGLLALTAPSIAATILAKIIANAAADIINGIITKALSDTYDINTSNARTTVSMIKESNNTRIKTLNYSGYEKWVVCHGYSGYSSEYTPSGITPRNWMLVSSYNLYWRDTYPNNSCPGVAVTNVY